MCREVSMRRAARLSALLPVASLHGPPEALGPLPPVGAVANDPSLLAAARHHVIQCPGKLDTKRSGHAGILNPRGESDNHYSLFTACPHFPLCNHRLSVIIWWHSRALTRRTNIPSKDT